MEIKKPCQFKSIRKIPQLGLEMSLGKREKQMDPVVCQLSLLMARLSELESFQCRELSGSTLQQSKPEGAGGQLSSYKPSSCS